MELYRTFDRMTRSITSDRKGYAGQTYDSGSTRIHFKIQDGGEDWDFKADGYVPYIVFAVYDEVGNPYVYGPDSSPVFSGYDFPIPYEITSRASSLRVEYNLWFVKAEVADNFNGTPDGLLVTEYLLSATDGVAFRASCIKPPKPGCGCNAPPYTPATAPTVIGALEALKSLAVIRPVAKEAHINPYGEEQGLDLYFKSISGEFQQMWLNVPTLSDDGKLKASQLPTGNGVDSIPLLKSMVGNGDAIVYDGAKQGFVAKKVSATAGAALAAPASLVQASAMGQRMEYVKRLDGEAGAHYLRLLDGNGQEICHVDLPLESMISKAYYDASKKSLIFEVDGAEEPIVVPVHDLVDTFRPGDENITIELVASGDAENPTIHTISLSSSFLARIKDDELDLAAHKDDVQNPHRVTKAQVGLGNVENLSPANMPVSDATAAAIASAKQDVSADVEAVEARVGVIETQLNGDSGEGGIIEKHDRDIARIDSETTAIRAELALKASSQDLATAVGAKQDRLIPGSNIAISDTNVISYVGPNIDVDSKMSATSTNPVQNRVLVAELDKLQPKLTAGTNIKIENGRIDATVPPTTVDDAMSYSSKNPVQNRVIARELDKKANIGEGVSVWKGITQDGLYLYNTGDVVVYDNALYISRVDNNDHHPDDETCWSVVRGATATQVVGITPATYIGVFGNTSDTVYTIEHRMNTRNIVFSFMRNDGSYQFVYPTMVSAPTLSTMRVQLPSPPGNNAIIVNMVKARTVTPSGVKSYPAVIEFATPDREWQVYNDTGKPLYVKAYNTEGKEVEGDAIQDSATGYSPLTIDFAEAVSGKLFLAEADVVKEYNGTSLDIPIASGDRYLVQCFSDGSGQFRPDIIQTDGNIHIASDIHWTGTVALYKATASKSWKAADLKQENGRYKISYQHNKGRMVGAQIYTSEGMVLGEMHCTDNVITIYADLAFDGELYII